MSDSARLINGKILKAEFGVGKSVFSLDVDSYYFDISNEVLTEEEDRWSFTPLTLEKRTSRAIPYINYFIDKMKYGRLTIADWADLRACINNILSQPKLWDYTWSTVSQLKKISGAISVLSTNGPGSEIFKIFDQKILAKCLVTLSNAFAFDDVNFLMKIFHWNSRWMKSKESDISQLRLETNKKIEKNKKIFDIVCSEIINNISGASSIPVYYYDNSNHNFHTLTSAGKVFCLIDDDGIFMCSNIKKNDVYRYDAENIGWTYLKVRQ